MTTATTAPPLPTCNGAAVPTDLIARLSVAQYHEMIRMGILTEDDKVELLEGWLVQKMPKTPSHSSVTRKIRKRLARMVTTGWDVDTQEPITLLDSEPEPDVLLLRSDPADYQDRHPLPADIGMVVEVSLTTLLRDQTTKKRIYARAGIVVYWIVNLVDRCVEVYTDPTGPAAEPDYRLHQVFGEPAEVPVILDGQEIGRLAVRDLFS